MHSIAYFILDHIIAASDNYSYRVETRLREQIHHWSANTRSVHHKIGASIQGIAKQKLTHPLKHKEKEQKNIIENLDKIETYYDKSGIFQTVNKAERFLLRENPGNWKLVNPLSFYAGEND